MKTQSHRITYGLVILILSAVSLQSVCALTFGERTLDLPAGTPGQICLSFRNAEKARLTYAGTYWVQSVDRETDEWRSGEVNAVLILDVRKHGDGYSLSGARLLLGGKPAAPDSVLRHVAMLALAKAAARSERSLKLTKSTIYDHSNVAQSINYGRMDDRCSIEIYGDDYLALKLKTGVPVSYGGRSYTSRECYYYKEFQNGGYFWESAYFHDSIPGRIGRFFRKSQNPDTKAKSEAESEDFDLRLSSVEGIP